MEDRRPYGETEDAPEKPEAGSAGPMGGVDAHERPAVAEDMGGGNSGIPGGNDEDMSEAELEQFVGQSVRFFYGLPLDQPSPLRDAAPVDAATRGEALALTWLK